MYRRVKRNKLGNSTLTHIATCDWQIGREKEENRRQRYVDERNDVGRPPKPAWECPRSFGEGFAPLKAIDCDGHGIREIKSYNRGRDDGIESAVNMLIIRLVLLQSAKMKKRVDDGIKKYLVEAKKMKPNNITTTDVRINALSGNPSRVWTFAKTREAGKPPSLIRLVCNRLFGVTTGSNGQG